MKVFRIVYEGITAGGEAIVVAADEEEALKILRAEPGAFGAEGAEVNEIDTTVAQLLMNDDGDHYY